MTFNELAVRVAKRCNKNENDSVVLTRIKAGINNVCRTQWNGFRWSFRNREFPITTLADVTTGTVEATNGSRAITFSSAVLDTTQHVGAWIRFTADSTQNWYKLLAVNSTTTATLEPAYQGTTGSTKNYELKKLDYLFPTELNDIGSIQATYAGHPMPVFTAVNMDEGLGNITYKGPPQKCALVESDFKGQSYTTGTVTGTINTNTLTGNGTAWLSNVSPGDCINIGSYYYTVYYVHSDTSITLYNNLVVAPSASTYSIMRRFGKRIRILPSSDQVYTVFAKGLRAYAPLVHNSDTNELTHYYPDAVEEAAVRIELSSTPDSRENDSLAIANAAFADARASDQSNTQRINTRPVWPLR